jgi:hypothetical protein
LAGFNVEAVAVVSGAARSTVYRHWPEPRELLVEALESMGRSLPVPDTGSLVGDIQACAAALRPIFTDPRVKRFILDVTRAAAEDPELERVRLQLHIDRQQLIQGILQRAIARGEVDPSIDMNVAFHLVQGPLMSATVFQSLPLGDEAIEWMVARIVKALT